MPSRLEPIAEGNAALPIAAATRETFALISRVDMTALARAMPNAQSAVLWCLGWHAAINARMSRGQLAGQQVAKVSASALAKITGRPIRTVYDALSKLQDHDLIRNVEDRPGRTAVYRLSLRTHQARPNHRSNGSSVAAAGYLTGSGAG
jgi:hypothetical protein